MECTLVGNLTRASFVRPTMHSLDRIVFETGNVRVGAFRCPLDDPRFHDTGPIQNHLVVFPRTAVWIRHAGSRSFVADPRIVTIYNKGQEYRRLPVARDGDRSDWFAVSPELACTIARHIDPHTEDHPSRPYQAQWCPSDTDLYRRQRVLFCRLERGEMDRLEAEERIIRLVALVIHRSHKPSARHHTRRAEEAHRDLAQRARAVLAKDPASPTDVTALAQRLDVSPFHLCRVFRNQTGLTLHRYRLDLRIRLAMEQLETGRSDLSRLAFELGFSSHSHFTAAFRNSVGRRPSDLRRLLTSSSLRKRASSLHPVLAPPLRRA
jgi:AraC-like DNA-binding protein